MKKLEKLNAPTSEKNKDALAMERIDQVSNVVYGFFYWLSPKDPIMKTNSVQKLVFL